MASNKDMSLDDIIKKSSHNGGRFQRDNFRPNVNKFHPKPITDARSIIISKNRTKITDAREKLAAIAQHKDARIKLQQLRMERSAFQHSMQRTVGNGFHQENRKSYPHRQPKFSRGFADTTRQVRSFPLPMGPPPILHTDRHVAYQDINSYEDVSIKDYPSHPRKPIVRTIKNAPRGRGVRSHIPASTLLEEDDVEMMEVEMVDLEAEYVPKPPSAPRGLNLKIIARNEAASQRRPVGVLKKSTERDKPSYSPPRPPSILKKRPLVSAMSSRLAATSASRPRLSHSSRLSPPRHSPPRSSRTRRPSPPPPPTFEYRIVISNLRSSVTGNDIKELFGDVGDLQESRLVRPGTAEVIYKSLSDAQMAVELYHNRQLDGQPMNCFLVNPRSPNAAPVSSQRSGTSSSSKTSLPASSNSSVVPDISTFHKVLFSSKH